MREPGLHSEELKNQNQKAENQIPQTLTQPDSNAEKSTSTKLSECHLK